MSGVGVWVFEFLADHRLSGSNPTKCGSVRSGDNPPATHKTVRKRSWKRASDCSHQPKIMPRKTLFRRWELCHCCRDRTPISPVTSGLSQNCQSDVRPYSINNCRLGGDSTGTEN